MFACGERWFLQKPVHQAANITRKTFVRTISLSFILTASQHDSTTWVSFSVNSRIEIDSPLLQYSWVPLREDNFIFYEWWSHSCLYHISTCSHSSTNSKSLEWLVTSVMGFDVMEETSERLLSTHHVSIVCIYYGRWIISIRCGRAARWRIRIQSERSSHAWDLETEDTAFSSEAIYILEGILDIQITY